MDKPIKQQSITKLLKVSLSKGDSLVIDTFFDTNGSPVVALQKRTLKKEEGIWVSKPIITIG